jgi:FkbM family methyltransferase
MQSQSIEKSGELVAMTYANSKRVGGIVAFDVGANVGDYTSSLSKVFNQDYRIFAFEPSLKIFPILSSKFQGNAHISSHNFGFSDTPKELKLYNSGDLYGTVYPLREVNESPEIIVLETIDGFCKSNKIDQIFYLKIDVEGAEIDVLKGAKQMLDSNSIHFIQFEFGQNSVEAKVYLKDFFRMLPNYTIYRIVKNGLRKIKGYNEILEIPLTSNFLAERNS